jgi:4-diphosphocytidyl-2-C-methyl-D-erythritol kinase
LKRRPNGYHEIITVMQPLSLADELKLTVAKAGGLSLSCVPEDLPQGRDNLVWRAAEEFLAASGLKIGVHLVLTKRIPVAAGLGGGSSDAAGTLLALNAATGRPLDDAALHRLGSQLGADVPFFLSPGPKIGQGTGTELLPLKLPPYWYVLLNPGLPISTKWVYENLDLSALNKINREAGAAWDGDHPGDWVANDLETVTLGHFPELGGHIRALASLGALAQGMSGSGPTLFGLFPTLTAAQSAASRLRETFKGWLAVARGLTGTEPPDGWENQVWII